MDRAEVLAMEPGRELNKAVANLVMDEIYNRHKDYSGDIAAAWEMFQHVKHKFLFSKRKKFMDELQNVVSNSNLKTDGHKLAYPDLFWLVQPVDFCKAALLAVEVEHGQG